ncbi:hypothetical protein ST201phi2-1p335 [Pseudomonas phage 201phi2-1]|uniref:Uncharacterized protein n=1 Tax=Pseudomonas phage 201phi2-1 TaxID=198110 RepID=B3FJJ5_BP201|nr:hypothetical protein ST201phi2-1p335 [Pseudomonas phage 201phi2-1]ABY63160.1 hypothetical protein 201phi2-1p335 [Pseudomonas phage 201phi2-1]
MSVIGDIKKYLTHQFTDPTVFLGIAQMLQAGIPIVKVRYRNVPEPRYYMGTGERYGNGVGKHARWMMTVTHFKQHDDGISRLEPEISPWMDQRELDLLLQWHNYDIHVMEATFVSAVTAEDQVDIIKDIVRRLKPGQGYNYSGSEIKTDCIQPDGYLIHTGSHKRIVPERFINTGLVFPRDQFGNDFKTKNLFVADEKRIRRQHRSNKDLHRWLVVKPVVSVNDQWAIKYTNGHTAHAPVHYYSVDIDIDNKAMKGHPFYIRELVEQALKDIHAIHSDGDYVFNPDNVLITWDGRSETLPKWLERAARYRASNDEEPIIITENFNGEVDFGYYNNVKLTLGNK